MSKNVEIQKSEAIETAIKPISEHAGSCHRPGNYNFRVLVQIAATVLEEIAGKVIPEGDAVAVEALAAIRDNREPDMISSWTVLSRALDYSVVPGHRIGDQARYEIFNCLEDLMHFGMGDDSYYVKWVEDIICERAISIFARDSPDRVVWERRIIEIINQSTRAKEAKKN